MPNSDIRTLMRELESRIEYLERENDFLRLMASNPDEIIAWGVRMSKNDPVVAAWLKVGGPVFGLVQALQQEAQTFREQALEMAKVAPLPPTIVTPEQAEQLKEEFPVREVVQEDLENDEDDGPVSQAWALASDDALTAAFQAGKDIWDFDDIESPSEVGLYTGYDDPGEWAPDALVIIHHESRYIHNPYGLEYGGNDVNEKMTRYEKAISELVGYSVFYECINEAVGAFHPVDVKDVGNK